MSSYFQAIRRLKDSNFYINAIASQFALWKATQDAVDNPMFKAYSRATTNRLICRELAETPVQRDAEFYQPGIPAEPGPVGPGGGTVTVMINFDHELQDRSTFNNDAIHEFTNQQLLFTDGKDTGLSFAVNFNPASNSTYDKLWIPFSPSTQIVYDTPNGFSIFTRIMPTVVTPLGTAASPVPLTNRMKDFGGPMLNKYETQVWQIYWGAGWNDSSAPSWGGTDVNGPAIRNKVDQMFQAICDQTQYWEGLWQYRGMKKLRHGGSVVHTETPRPALGERATFLEIGQVVAGAMFLGEIPNANLEGEDIFVNGALYSRLDWKHIFIIHLDPRNRMPPGFRGAAQAWHTEQDPRVPVGPTGRLSYYLMCSFELWSDQSLASIGSGATASQGEIGVMLHELLHHTNPLKSCTAGVGGFGYNPAYQLRSGQTQTTANCGFGICHTECDSIGKIFPGLTVGGTAIGCPTYWSDMDGRCIAPGVDNNWTRPPANMGPVIRRYIFQKLDDLDNGATAAIGDDGTVYFNVKKAGIEYKVKSAPGSVLVNEWADCWFTFNSTTNTPEIYINNFKYAIASTEVLLWNNTHSHTILANYNMGATVGQFRGKMDDFRLYRSAVVTTQDVDNLNGNGLTVTGIENTPEQGVFIVNRVKIDKKLDNTSVYVPGDADSGDVPAANVSFTDTSFSTSSFTT